MPVFRYALERWSPAAYDAFVFHRGPLTPSQKHLVGLLSGEVLSNQPPANLTVTTVDLEAQPAPDLLQTWERYRTNALPMLLLRFPRGAPAEGTVWSGPLTEPAVQAVLQSPARKRLARGLLKGDTAVWLLLESGDKARDDEAARLLQSRLAHLQQTLKLPKIEEEDLTSRVLSVPESALRVGFSFIRVSRADPAETVLVHCLLGTEDDLRDGRETIAFPVFGRGRALCALVGKGITAETVDEAGEFLVGPCSCVVKEENPGLDLLLAVDWESQIRLISPGENAEPPPLTGLTASLAASNLSGLATGALKSGDLVGPGSGTGAVASAGGLASNPAPGLAWPARPAGGLKSAVAPAKVPEVRPPGSGHHLRFAFMLLAGVAVFVLVAGAILWRRR